MASGSLAGRPRDAARNTQVVTCSGFGGMAQARPLTADKRDGTQTPGSYTSCSQWKVAVCTPEEHGIPVFPGFPSSRSHRLTEHVDLCVRGEGRHAVNLRSSGQRLRHDEGDPLCQSHGSRFISSLGAHVCCVWSSTPIGAACSSERGWAASPRSMGHSRAEPPADGSTTSGDTSCGGLFPD